MAQQPAVFRRGGTRLFSLQHALRDLYPSRPLGLRGGIQTSLCMDTKSQPRTGMDGFVTLFFLEKIKEIWYRGLGVA